MEEIQKKCTRCFKQKYLYEFYDKKAGKHNKASVCIQCNKEMRLLSKIAKGFLFEHTTKICTKCYHEKDLCEFHLNPLGKYGYKSVCMECTHTQRAERFAREDFNDLKIRWAKEQYQGAEYTVVDCNDEEHGYYDMMLLSRCKHQIIANSSFSWWSAWLNPNPEKKVIAPAKWLNHKDSRDIYTDWMLAI